MTRTVRRTLAGAIRLITGARPIGSPSGLPSQAVFFANHSSHLDFVTIWALLPGRIRDRVRPVAAGDYWGTGLRRRIAVGIFNAHLVDRSGSARPGSQIESMLEVLDAGDSLIIFPEGTRGRDEIAPFHGGLHRLARERPAVPIVPVALGNLGRILPKGGIVPVPHLATAAFLDPIALETGESRDDFLARARELLAAELRESETETETETDSEPDADDDAETASETASETDPESDTEAATLTDVETATDSEPDADTDVETSTDAETATIADADADADAETDETREPS